MKSQKNRNSLLLNVGARVRALRQEKSMTVREFAVRAQLSPRFINQLETGEGNISIARLAEAAEALGCALPELLPPPETDHSLRARTWRLLSECSDADWLALHTWLERRRQNHTDRQFVALIGLRGAGKSTIGPQLAKQLKTEFIELDQWVEEAAGISLAEIFHLHGEAYFHRLESEALQKLFTTSPGCVFAPGGSIVNNAKSWELIKQRCLTVWLHATPQEFMRRMTKAGETRLTQRPTVMTDLKALLARREPLYAESDLTLKTTGKNPAEIVTRITKAVIENHQSRAQKA
ncbi:MAG TPA: shikimate kinase [Blastocatellia bacterium]|nr:shikimate kinase [Blastocatellia bacterium]